MSDAHQPGYQPARQPELPPGLTSERQAAAQAYFRQQAFAQAIHAAPAPIMTYAMIVLNVLVYLGMIATGASFMNPTPQQAITWGADFGPLTLGGQGWRLLTACFVHFGLIHIGMNMFILWQVGQFTEKLYGNARYLLLYLLAGIGGNIAGLFYHPATVSAGASGAVFGVYGGLLAFLLIQRGVVPGAAAMSIAKSAGIFIAYNIIYGLASPQTDLTAHFGGLVTGFLVGCILARPLSPQGQKLYPIRTLAVALAGLAITWASLRAMPRAVSESDDWTRQLIAGKSVSIGTNNRVIYSGQATQSEAQALAQALTDAGYFHKANGVVLLSKGPDGTILSLPTGEADPARTHHGTPALAHPETDLSPLPWNDPGYIAGALAIGVTVAPSIGGPPIKLALLNSNGEQEKLIDVNARLVTIGKNDSVWYSGSATLEQARALGSVLQQNKFFIDTQRRVFFAKDAEGTSVSFMLREGAWDNPKLIVGFGAIGRKLANSVGGTPLTIYLINNQMTREKAIAIK